MARLSERFSNAVRAVKCPGCGARVVPVDFPAPEPSAGQPPRGERWSFIWVAPIGESCPECHFPLARYHRRRIWIRLLLSGVALLGIAGLLSVPAVIGDIGPLLSRIRQLTALVGGIVFIVGLTGTVIGGRRS